MKKYAKIIIQSLSDKLDRFFTYLIPNEFMENIFLGSVVKVSFGNHNKIVFGFVFEILDENELLESDRKYLKNIKSIKSVDDRFFLSNESLELIKYIKQKYLCSYYEAISLFIPSKFLDDASLKIKDYIFLDTDVEVPNKFKKEPYTSILKFVYENQNIYDKSELSKMNKFSKSSISTLIKHGILKIKSKELSVASFINCDNYEKKCLNYEQKKVYNEIIEGEDKVFLVHGVTGSGKTELYLAIFEHFIKNGGDCIILVPEISLTPQMIERVKGRFNNDVVVYHSKLTVNERYTEWEKVISGKVKVAIGTRSALFLPFKNLSCIVIDEEHESTYKSESDPKYIVKDVAIEYSKLKDNLKVILGSATPSIESYYKAKINEYKLLEIKNRVNFRKFPKIEIINMKDELNQGNKSIFSKTLYSKINERIFKEEQTILFLNKRGFSSFVSCRSCGYVYKCKFCDITLTYHGASKYLMCHYCGYGEKNKNQCVKCGSNYVKYFGIGTEKVELLSKKFFPNARILRMDFDTTRKKNSYSEIYDKIKNKEVDIIIGTQMIAKGFDFENVTLVGVLAADLSMNIPDYKAYERTFQLLNQVSGRAGRGEKLGEVCIQTYDPDSYVIRHSRNNDYKSFYDEEIKIRKTLNYPPFTDILNVLFQSKDVKFYDEVIIYLYQKLKNEFSSMYQILGPSSCMISKINDYYRWQIIIKGKYDFEVYNKIKEMIYENLQNFKFEYKVSFDVNPYSIF
ncbi:replication restart helicase PriA [Candidatus Arthromitus sp. SFB-turkey]|uniref:replication restart helicase PriA n=1 Tax=Candidatus Arthromitus sp. SFB-turkey TaxID=1840217 RepID=UPI0007F5124B|nr:primosomal protein N' [Candidatus Arthromitus sp. SFB-turkey]OAT89704.1 primosomal protein N' [Candidatus Arthromitus sp. SFB-turkey]